MKPQRIIFVRHGQSEGNVDKTIMDHKPDYALELTDLGHQQAEQRGQEIAKIIGDDTIQWYISPYFRTRQTFLELRKAFTPPYKVYEDPRLREQDWGNWRNGVDYNKIEESRDSFGHFYFRLPNGESCADVCDRFSSFLNTMFRDFQKPNFAQNVIIVTHGLAMRAAVCRFLHLSVEQFEELANPPNCGTYILNKDHNDRYTFDSEPKRYNSQRHPYQFKWPAGGLSAGWIN